MSENQVAVFAQEFRRELEGQGISALERTDWADMFKRLGFEMDCGRSYEERFGLHLNDVDGLKREIERIDDVHVLGNAVFSQCRYITHWAMGGCEDERVWLLIALKRLEELASVSLDAAPLVVAYRYATEVEATVKEFCKRALPDEKLPLRVEYSVSEQPACDAYIDVVRALIELPAGDVLVEIEVVEPCGFRMVDDSCETYAKVDCALRTVEDDEGEEVDLRWDDGRGRWECV